MALLATLSLEDDPNTHGVDHPNAQYGKRPFPRAVIGEPIPNYQPVRSPVNGVPGVDWFGPSGAVNAPRGDLTNYDIGNIQSHGRLYFRGQSTIGGIGVSPNRIEGNVGRVSGIAGMIQRAELMNAGDIPSDQSQINSWLNPDSVALIAGKRGR